MGRSRLDLLVKRLNSLEPPLELMERVLTFHQVSKRGHIHLSNTCRNIKKATEKIEITLAQSASRHVCINCSYTLSEQDKILSDIMSVAQDIFSTEMNEYRESKLVEKEIYDNANEFLAWEISLERLQTKIKDIAEANFLSKHIISRRNNFCSSVRDKIGENNTIADIKIFAAQSLVVEYARVKDSKIKIKNRLVRSASESLREDEVFKSSIVKLWLLSLAEEFSIDELLGKLVNENPLLTLGQISDQNISLQKEDENLKQYVSRVYLEECKEKMVNTFKVLDKIYELELKNMKKVLVVIDKKSSLRELNPPAIIIKYMSQPIYEDSRYYLVTCSVPESKVLLLKKNYQEHSIAIPRKTKNEYLKKLLPEVLSIYEPGSHNLYSNFGFAFKAIENLNK
jgi:hypothetical protein